MNLFEAFKTHMLTNDEICHEVADKVLAGISTELLKKDFSKYLSRMQDDIYTLYLDSQLFAGQKVIDEQTKVSGTVDFNDLDKFFLSLSQSRKSRAGKAFEFIIEVMLVKLGYPFSDQVVIDGAKPDYVMPSEEYFRDKPLDSIILTAKRTLRERWRQVVTEANKGYGYYLATIDEKITKSQIQQAETHKIYIVVPRALKENIPVYADSYSVISFEKFFEQQLDPAMKRWGLALKMENSADSNHSQHELDI